MTEVFANCSTFSTIALRLLRTGSRSFVHQAQRRLEPARKSSTPRIHKRQPVPRQCYPDAPNRRVRRAAATMGEYSQNREPSACFVCGMKFVQTVTLPLEYSPVFVSRNHGGQTLEFYGRHGGRPLHHIRECSSKPLPRSAWRSRRTVERRQPRPRERPRTAGGGRPRRAPGIAGGRTLS